ncbi:MAG: YidE/YbjL duplication [Proteobacteria bacterium]|nr:YidE/YbjL duplication [Pseudomonadota bacterium]
MQAIGAFLDTQPFIALFLVVGLGYAVGRITVAGFSLGIGAVLFVGLAVGAIAPKASPPGLLSSIGLILFLYGTGIQYGRTFFKGLVSSFGLRANLLAAVAVVAGSAVAMLCARWFGFSIPSATGMFAGSLTSTASLQAAITTSGSDMPAVAYAIAYPFRVFGPILLFFLTHKLLRPKVEAVGNQHLQLGEVNVDQAGLVGLTIGEVRKKLPPGAAISVLRRGGSNHLVDRDTVLKAGDQFLVSGQPAAIRSMELPSDQSDIRSDRHDFDVMLVHVSREPLVGKRLDELPLPKDIPARILQVRRGDVDLVPTADLVVEYGDQLGLVAPPEHLETFSKIFGDSVNAEAQFSFMSFGLGMAAGGLLGLVPIPIPGVGMVHLGAAGGVIVTALVLGYLRRLGPFDWSMPQVTNTIIRNFGLTVFLAGVGMASGAPFVSSIAQDGLPLLLAGVIQVLVVVLIVIFGGWFVLRMKYDDLLGIASGATGNPAILAYGNQLCPTGRPNTGYAMIFPGVGTILKIVLVQVMLGADAP